MTDDDLRPRRSLSQLSLYASCSEKYRLKKMVYPRPPERPAAWLVHGNALHSAYERWEKGNRFPDILDLYKEEWEKELEAQWEAQPNESLWVKTPRVKSVHTDLALRYEAGLIQAEKLQEHCEAEMWVPATINSEMAVEVPFELDIAGIQVIGYIDLIKEWPDGELTVEDLKTGSPKEDFRQLGLYAYVCREVFGLDVFFGEYWYTKLDRVPKSGDKAGRSSGLINLSRYDRAYWEDIFSALDKGISEQVFLPNPGDGCTLCEVKDLCREWSTPQSEASAGVKPVADDPPWETEGE